MPRCCARTLQESPVRRRACRVAAGWLGNSGRIVGDIPDRFLGETPRLGVRQREFLDDEPRKRSDDCNDREGNQKGRPGFPAEQADGNRTLHDGVVKNIRPVREVSPARWALDLRQQQRSTQSGSGDGSRAEGEPSCPDMQAVICQELRRQSSASYFFSPSGQQG
jgi:hypothetical protein